MIYYQKQFIFDTTVYDHLFLLNLSSGTDSRVKRARSIEAGCVKCIYTRDISLKFCRDLSKAPFSKPFNISYGVNVILVFIASLKRNDN